MSSSPLLLTHLIETSNMSSCDANISEADEPSAGGLGKV